MFISIQSSSMNGFPIIYIYISSSLNGSSVYGTEIIEWLPRMLHCIWECVTLHNTRIRCIIWLSPPVKHIAYTTFNQQRMCDAYTESFRILKFY